MIDREYAAGDVDECVPRSHVKSHTVTSMPGISVSVSERAGVPGRRSGDLVIRVSDEKERREAAG
ncbi:hypothetical protein [Natronorubrum sp. FCH18a]|uniref:hypothetical protein n=1 Tax=Natronorubrum sp. FCH18a TaxID=3447018 RepID=UPI003F519EFF